MADNAELAQETAEALLTAIKDAAPKEGYQGVQALAYAYALVVSAVPGQPPTTPPISAD